MSRVVIGGRFFIGPHNRTTMSKHHSGYPRDITTTSRPELEEMCPRASSSSAGSHEERWSEENINRASEVWRLSKEEAEQLRSLKERLSDVNHRLDNPHELVKYIKGPKGHEKAEQVFRNMLDWRLEFGTDRILDEFKPPQILYDYVPTSMLKGVDHEGDPVYVERAGVVDGLGLVRHFDRAILLKHTVWLREQTANGVWRQDYEREHGHMPRQLTIVLDLEGLSSRHVKKEVISVFKELVSYTADKYYGVSKRMIIIRAPAIFRMVWRLARNFYSPEVQKKMIFASKNYLDTIDQYMDRDILPPCINPQGHGETAFGFPPNLKGGLIPASLDEDDNYSECSRTQSRYTLSATSSFDSSGDDLMDRISETVTVSVACKSLCKGSLSDNAIMIAEGV